MKAQAVFTPAQLLGRWWRSLDRWSLVALIALLMVGIVLVAASSPAVAGRLGLDPFYFLYRHLFFFPISLALLIGCSFLDPRRCFLFAWVLFLVSFVFLLMTLIDGDAVKGASRWIDVGSFSLQPSEFIKPAFALVFAYILSFTRSFSAHRTPRPGVPYGGVFFWCALIWGGLIAVLASQPDIGQSVLISVVALAQIALVCDVIFLIGGFLLLFAGLFGAYLIMPHVAARIDAFLDPASSALYQLSTSYKAFAVGGIFGKGPGHGQIKRSIPDAHSDFIFAVGAEEFGLLFCLALLFLLALIVLRSLYSIARVQDKKSILAACGLLAIFAGQCTINIASTIGLIPTKGMTLPFVSYGGSSLLGSAVTMGLLLALTRRRFSAGARAMPVPGGGA